MEVEFEIGGHVLTVNGMPRPTRISVTGVQQPISVRWYKDWWRHQHHGSFEDYVRSHSIPRRVADEVVRLFSWMKTPDARPSRYQGFYNQLHKNIKHQYK